MTPGIDGFVRRGCITGIGVIAKTCVETRNQLIYRYMERL